MSLQEIAARAAATSKTNGKNGAHPKPAASKPTNGEHPLPTIYYDAPKRAFWSLNQRREWIEYPGQHIRLILLDAGVTDRITKGENMTEVERLFMQIRQANDVQWAGALAGFQPGVYDVCGTRVLVTSGPRVLKAARGKWDTLRTFLHQLLGDQVEHLYGWLKSALRSLHAGRPWRPGQALAIAGPAGCGKSLLQSLFTELLGGRVAKPYRYLIGDTAFNGELLAAEHLAIEDEAASTDLRTRRHFGSQLKNLIANEVISFHQKGRQAMSFTPFWRVTITLNDEPENLMVLPPLDESLKDKIMLVRAFATNLPFGTDNLAERAKFRASLSSELPAFLHFLHGWRIPPRMTDKRYGVKAYHNADLMRDLEQLQPEFRLLELIDTLHIWAIDATSWKGTATELRRELMDKDKRNEVDRLLSYNTAAGTYLGRLAKHLPHRVSKERGENNLTLWTITRQV
jgi:hypothetical protein